MDEDAETLGHVRAAVGCVDSLYELIHGGYSHIIKSLGYCRAGLGGEVDGDGLAHGIVSEVHHAAGGKGELVVGGVGEVLIFKHHSLACNRGSEFEVAQSSLDTLFHLNLLIECEDDLTVDRCVVGALFGNLRYEHRSHTVVNELGSADDV